MRFGWAQGAAALPALLRAGLSRRDAGAAASRATAVAFAIRVANAVLVYVSQVVLARLMGQFEYGVFAYGWVWFLVIGTAATLGFAESPVRYLPGMRARGEADHVRGFLRFGPLVVAAAGTAAAALTAAALLAGRTFLDGAYIAPMLLMAASLPFACLQGFLEGVARAYGWTAAALVPVYIMRHGLLLALLLAAVGLGLAATAVNAFALVTATVVLSLAYQWHAVARRLRDVVRPGGRAYRRREWVGGSLPFAVMYGTAQLFAFADVLVLSFFVGPAEIAVYFAATRVIQVIGLIPFAATVGTARLFSAHHAAGDMAAMQRITQGVAFWTTVTAIALAALVALSGRWLLGLFGAGYDAGFAALLILSVGLVARVAAGPAEDLLNMTGHGRLSAWTYVVTIAVNIVLNVALIVPFGIAGAAIGTATTLLLRAVWLAAAARRRLGIRTSILAARPSLASWAMPPRSAAASAD